MPTRPLHVRMIYVASRSAKDVRRTAARTSPTCRSRVEHARRGDLRPDQPLRRRRAAHRGRRRAAGGAPRRRRCRRRARQRRPRRLAPSGSVRAGPDAGRRVALHRPSRAGTTTEPPAIQPRVTPRRRPATVQTASRPCRSTVSTLLRLDRRPRASCPRRGTVRKSTGAQHASDALPPTARRTSTP